jgi:parallel beta-helix repeat protein
MTLKLASNAVLQAIPNASSNYAIISANNVSQVSVVGGTLIGDRSSHTGTTGEWGMGLSIAHAQQVVVDGVTARECWGDGFIVTSASSNVAVCNVTSSHNRRQGLTITSVDGMVVRNSNFSHSQGTSPETGINVEPNSGETVNNVLITGCTLANNAGGGFQCGTALANVGSTSVTGLVLDQNLVTGNGLNPVLGPYRVAVYMTVFDGAQITNNQVVNNIGQGICLTGNATHTMVKGNTVQGTMKVMGSGTWTGIGILISTCSGSTISSNTVTGNAGPGIEQIILDPTVTISNNTVSGNGS